MSTSLQWNNTTLKVHNFNNDFLLLNAENDAPLGKIGQAILGQQLDFVAELIVTEKEICIKLNSNYHPSKLENLTAKDLETITPNKAYKLPVYFEDHEDWKLVEAHSGMTKGQVINRLSANDFSVAMFGFLPGFLYLNGLEEALQVPRKKVPSKYVKANSIAIGGKYLGLYSLDSPGGWNVIGRVPFSILQLSELPPVPFQLGDTLRLHPISAEAYHNILRKHINLHEYNA